MKNKIISVIIFLYLIFLGYGVGWNVIKTQELHYKINVIGSMIYAEQLQRQKGIRI